ncbi:hypothetical protein SBD_6350 [Streptomyces bottropensis ATCC 25435]|uniref:Uncharacterized protein n=1 Tax=Streptomyces bottropensis ATCC 25435 TaxID=1054862 RepID=M3ERX1_9ACTN|nr:hypothetical protein SBD_6350 [Streptomyces bottropensis ATCC 25435]
MTARVRRVGGPRRTDESAPDGRKRSGPPAGGPDRSTCRPHRWGGPTGGSWGDGPEISGR